MKILLTGSAGYIGSEVLFRLKMKGLTVFGCDKGDPVMPSDVTIHLASDIYGTQKKDFLPEIELTKKILRTTKRKIIFSSSAAVYGDGYAPSKENQLLRPINEYGKAKMLIEQLIKDCFKGRYSIFRLGNVYSKNAIHGFVKNVLSGGNTLYNHGEGIRDYVELRDVVDVIVDAALNDLGWLGTYNIATGVGHSAKKIFQRLTTRKPISKEKPEIKKSILDITKAKQLGFSPLLLD